MTPILLTSHYYGKPPEVYNTNKVQPIPRDQEVTLKLKLEENKGKEEIACVKTHLKNRLKKLQTPCDWRCQGDQR